MQIAYLFSWVVWGGGGGGGGGGCLGVVCCFSVLIKGCLRAKCHADSIPFSRVVWGWCAVLVYLLRVV